MLRLLLKMTFLKEAFPEMTSEEELQFFNDNCELVLRNVRFYLDHLDDGTLWVYRVSFLGYKK